MDYAQPDFYSFSEDSTKLAKWCTEQNLNEGNVLKVADVGCGCGVIGIEFASQWYDLTNNTCDLFFIEKQLEFVTYIEKNLKSIAHKVSAEIINSSVDKVQLSNEFDLVLSNPPYFFEGSGRVGPNKKRNTCRHISEEELALWFSKVHSILRPGGDFFFVFRNLEWLEKVCSGFVEITRREGESYSLIHWRKL